MNDTLPRRTRVIVHIDRDLAERMRQTRGVDWDAVAAEAVRFKLKMLRQTSSPAAAK